MDEVIDEHRSYNAENRTVIIRWTEKNIFSNKLNNYSRLFHTYENRILQCGGYNIFIPDSNDNCKHCKQTRKAHRNLLGVMYPYALTQLHTKYD
jgi:hypothetical protein